MMCALNSLSYDAIYDLYDILGLELMSLVWLCVWNMIGWLVEYGHEIDMHDNSMVGWWSMTMVWVGRNSMNLLVRFMVVPHVMDVIPRTS